MAKFTAPPAQENNFEPIPIGNHAARCVSFVDLGTQSFEYNGETKSARKVRLGFEVPGEMRVFDEEKGEQPCMVSIELSISFHEKSNLKKHLDAWFGKAVNEANFDPETDLLGKPAMVNVTHKESKSGHTYACISSITPLPKGMDCPKQINPSTYFFMGWLGLKKDFQEDVFAVLPKFIQDKISVSPEYKTAIGDNPNETEEEKTKREAEELFG
jgi:hypothetical protein